MLSLSQIERSSSIISQFSMRYSLYRYNLNYRVFNRNWRMRPRNCDVAHVAASPWREVEMFRSVTRELFYHELCRLLLNEYFDIQSWRTVRCNALNPASGKNAAHIWTMDDRYPLGVNFTPCALSVLMPRYCIRLRSKIRHKTRCAQNSFIRIIMRFIPKDSTD